MKNVLFIIPFMPYPLTSGGHQGSFNGIAMLENIANVFIICDCTESQYKRGLYNKINEALPFVQVIPYILPESRHTLKWYIRAIKNKISSAFVRKKQKVSQVYTRSVYELLEEPVNIFTFNKLEFINKCIEKFKIDIVQSEYFECLSVVDFLPNTVQKYFLHHELRYVRDELLLKQSGCDTDSFMKRLSARKQQEIDLLNKYDVIITVSTTDAEKLKQSGVTSKILPSFSIVCNTNNGNDSYPVEHTISFVGPENHYPNYNGILWFLNNCWNHLLSKEPEYSLKIIGLWSEETQQTLSKKFKNLKFLGYVKNLGDAICGSTMIVPINIGSGIRMKILEAARLNVPVVSTVVGAEGLPIEDGVHAFITNDAAQFVEDIIKLQDESLRRKFVNSTNELISKNYSVEALKDNRQSLYI